VYLDTERPVHMALERLSFMLEAHHWLDASSKSLQVQIPILNLETTPSKYGLLEIRFDFTRSGDLTKRVELKMAAVTPYPAFRLSYFVEVGWCALMIWLFFKEFYKVAKYFLKKRERHDVLCNFWFLYDWATLLCGAAMMGSWIYIVNQTGVIETGLQEMPPAPAFDASEVLVKAYHAAWGQQLDNIEYITIYRDRIHLGQFGYAMLLMFQFIKAYRGQPKLAQLTRTLINALEDLTHFLACFVILFLSFAFSGHLVYGMNLEQWSTSTKCVNTAFRALRGDIELVDMYEVAPITTTVWFFLFLVSMIFIMMNLLLATIYDHYQLVKTKANAFTGIGLQAKDALKDVWHREGVKMFLCGCCCRCRRSPGFPSHEDMLEELMYKAGYTNKEKHHVFRTVLGSKWMRKKTEKHVFAGEVSADHLKYDEMQPAKQDLLDFGVDPDYVDTLLEDAGNYREREFDPDEVHENQMRELVTLAEIEMAYMRKRLDNCQGHMRLTMHDLARRLETLERGVHTGLQDLVFLAGTAGVPERTEHKASVDQFGTSPSACKKTNALSSVYKRTMHHLSQGVVAKLKKERDKHQEDMAASHNVRVQNNTYKRLHESARLADAFGEDEKRRVARKYAMHV